MEPTRLIDGNGFERELLEAARTDVPNAGAWLRSAAALGLAASSASVAATTAGTASAAGAKAGAAVLGSISIAKWMGIGAAVGLVASSGARLATDPELVRALTEPNTPATNVPAPAATKPRAEVALRRPPAAEEVRPAESFAPSDEPKAVETPKVRASSAAPAEPPRAPEAQAAPPSLAAEVDSLERARRALLAHRPNDVFRALDQYGAERQTSVLEAEAELLRVEALLQAGQSRAAARIARSAVEKTPNGPHAARLREIAAGQ